jgi:large subunit ribosomal protein L4
MSAKVLTKEAAEKAGIKLVDEAKGSQAVHDVVVALRAARRSGSANAKTRAEVAFSGKKPWKQKGTGRARAGSAGSPVWVGGGVVFGPRPRDYSKAVPKKVKRLAFRKAFTERIADGEIIIVDSFAVSQPRTKEFVKLIEEHSGEKKTLVIGKTFDQNTFLAARNVQAAQLITADSVNTEQLLAYRKIVITTEGLDEIARRTT